MSLKNTLDFAKKFSESPMFKNLPKVTPPLETIISENPVHKTNKTIEELKDIIVQQGITADKQANSIMWLTYLALVFAFISITPILREYIPIIAPKNHDRDIYELKNKVLSLSNTNLENQVRILKVENELLKAKKTSEKEKNLP
ncbi:MULTISPECIES: hypothetical protein [unclassified Flavobacterium]|jgi:hypothetical protein|uniref:hypothetical protein n=1 Tax=unclassified Flavobacterium TaxID=196869 RepID=UPI0025C5083A|nr:MULTISPECIES: hypothetical protein [unclassified Flavobacterium]